MAKVVGAAPFVEPELKVRSRFDWVFPVKLAFAG